MGSIFSPTCAAVAGRATSEPAGKIQHPLPTGIVECCQQMAVKPRRWRLACSSI